MENFNLHEEIRIIIENIPNLDPTVDQLVAAVTIRYRGLKDPTYKVLQGIYEGVGHQSLLRATYAAQALAIYRDPSLVDYWVKKIIDDSSLHPSLKGDGVFAPAQIDDENALAGIEKILNNTNLSWEEIRLKGTVYLAGMKTAGASALLLTKLSENPIEISRALRGYYNPDWNWTTITDVVIHLVAMNDPELQRQIELFIEQVAPPNSPNREKLRKRLQESDLKLKGVTDETTCFIATAASGIPYTPEVIILRKFRDQILTRSQMGIHVMVWYEFFSTQIEHLVSRSRILRIFIISVIIRPAGKLALAWIAKHK
ncbi:MAG: hypothetical protein KC643_22545 [Nitrospira sp.]|nr:hypothetical protein [Nitrospira sp.]